MEGNSIKKKETCDEIAQLNENIWKELISHGGNKGSKYDERTQLVFKALREKLVTETQEQEKSDIEIQLEKCELQLEELRQFGNELVNNIKSANEKYELLQCQHKHEKEIELQGSLRKEADLSLKQFEEISAKWTEINSLKGPMAIHEEMEKQRDNVANLMASKDKIIEQCQQELMQINNKYSEDQDKQSVDICILVDRVDHQVKLLKNFYRTSINDLQCAIDVEKQKMLNAAQEKWNTVYQHLTVSEDKKIELVKDKQQFYAQELENIRKKQEEISRTTKIRLEKEAEILELEIRKTQANILINSEKIDYNYQVLQKRNDENIIINNQQKRRVAKLNESIVVLKKKLAEIRENNNLAMEKLTVDIQKLHASSNELQAKSKFFRKNNATKLAKVCKINFKEIKHLVSRVFEIDRILYQQQLGRKWVQPNFNLDKLDLTKDDFQFPRSADMFAAEEEKKVNPNPNLLHDILHKISDRADFLVEERLLEILKPYTDDDQCLVKIESIFSALNIKNITVVESLIKYFEPYSWCPNCSSSGLYSKTRSSAIENTDDEKKNSQSETKANSADTVCGNHIPSIEPTLVLNALNEFIANEINKLEKSTETRKYNKKMGMDLLELDKNYITSYWQQFSTFMSKEQQNVWKSIEHGLNHYLEVLKRRAQIDSECILLQNQNAELKHLLQKL